MSEMKSAEVCDNRSSLLNKFQIGRKDYLIQTFTFWNNKRLLFSNRFRFKNKKKPVEISNMKNQGKLWFDFKRISSERKWRDRCCWWVVRGLSRIFLRQENIFSGFVRYSNYRIKCTSTWTLMKRRKRFSHDCSNVQEPPGCRIKETYLQNFHQYTKSLLKDSIFIKL